MFSVTCVSVEDALANQVLVFYEPGRFADSCWPCTTCEVPIYSVHDPPLGHKVQYRPGNDPEEAEVEQETDPSCAPAVDDMRRIDVNSLTLDRKCNIHVSTILRRSHE